jgi:hypothetical protein
MYVHVIKANGRKNKGLSTLFVLRLVYVHMKRLSGACIRVF